MPRFCRRSPLPAPRTAVFDWHARPGALDRLTPPWQRWLGRIGTRAFWLEPWPWIVVGLAAFGLLAWGLFWGMRRMERD